MCLNATLPLPDTEREGEERKRERKKERKRERERERKKGRKKESKKKREEEFAFSIYANSRSTAHAAAMLF